MSDKEEMEVSESYEDEVDASSTTSSDDDEEDDENKLIQQYIEVLGRIDQNKYNYDDYVLLVKIAHEISDLEKIRESCELFASVYPLAPEIWLKWLRIELTIATSDAEYKKVHQLFRRALADYYSTTVALEYANLTIKNPKANENWDVLLSTYTLDCMQGRSLFEAWRSYFMKEEPESPDKYEKIVKMYEQELSIPLYDMEETYIGLKVLCEKEKDKFNVDWTVIDDKYNKAKDQLKKILPFEKRLAELDAKDHRKRADLYLAYITESKEYLNDRIVQVLYERMITDCCLNPLCWLSYIKYIQSRDGFQTTQTNSEQHSLVFNQTDWDVCNRALRNCPWSSELYVEKMRIAEKMEISKQEVQNIVELALGAGFHSPEPLVTIWLEYLSYLRRNINFKCEKEVEILRATFTLAWDTLGRQFGVLADCNCEILQMWGRLEYGPLNDLPKGKELWTTVMESADNASKTGMWIEFAHLELKKGVDGARKVYRKALATPDLDDLSVITSAWIRFERCNGTLDQLKSCQEQCSERLVTQQLQNSYDRSHGKRTTKAPVKRKFQKSNNEDDKRQNSNKVEKREKPGKKSSIQAKPSSTKNNDIGSPPRKRDKIEDFHDHQEIDTSKDDVTIFLSNLSYKTTEDDIIEGLPELDIKHVNIIKSVNGNSRGFGYVQLGSAEEVEKSLSFDRRPINDRPVFISSVLRDREQRKKFKYSESMEPTKIFVRGLNYDSTKEELEQVFGKFGPVKDVRLVYHKSGTPKGIAYIEFNDDKSASKAVMKMDQTELNNYKISVAISAPPVKPQQSMAPPKQALGEGRRLTKPKGDAKPRMSFIPRSVQKKVLDPAIKSIDQTEASTSAATSAPKSNDDFRKLLNK